MVTGRRLPCCAVVFCAVLLQLPVVRCGAEVPRPSLWRQQQLAVRAVRATAHGLAAQRVPSSHAALRRLQPTAASEMRHNGTHLERVVQARWQCTYPDGECYTNHAPLEGLPEKMEHCTEEKNRGPLIVDMVINLQCAGLDGHIKCERSGPQEEFDPFYACNNDPLLLKARCHIDCRDSKPFEVCTFEFDAAGAFNMSDETIETCNLEAACKSPYVEQNEMFCSGHATAKGHKPHWLSEDAWAHRAQNGLQAPPASAGMTVEAQPLAAERQVPQVLPQAGGEGTSGEVFWAVVWVMLLIAGGLLAWRLGCLPESLNTRLEAIVGLPSSYGAGSGRIPPPYGARGRQMQYVAPKAPSSGAKPAGASADPEEAAEFAPGGS